MKQVFSLGGTIIVEEIDAPVIDDNSVLVMNLYSAISVGTEKATISKKQETSLIKRLLIKTNLTKGYAMVKEIGIKRTLKAVKDTSELLLVPMGYSSAGKVIAVGKNITDISPGDLVACAGGGFATHAEIVKIPKNLICKVPQNVNLKEAAFTTLGAIALQGIRRSKLALGETAIVIGVGLLGQLTCQMLTASGVKIIALDLIDKRLEIAKQNGADLCINPSKIDASKEIERFTDGIGADAIIITASSKSNDIVNQAMEFARKKGRVVVVGDIGMDLDRNLMYPKELDFLISTSYGPGRYDSKYEIDGIDYPFSYVRWTENRNMKAFVELLASKKISLSNIIEEEFQIDDAVSAYSTINKKNPLAIVLKYKDDPSKAKKISRKTILKQESTIGSKIKVGIIGAGQFAKGVHIPNLKKITECNLEAVIDINNVNARNTAKKHGARISGTDYKEINSKDIDLAIITTQHDSHADLSIAFAEKGINILIEKPLALNLEDCLRVQKSVQKNKIILAIGYNRRFAPLSQLAKKILKNRTSPIIMTYRINSSSMAKDHWINDPKKGGGAILGEAVHFYDYCNWLIGSEPKEINAKMISSKTESIINSNNIISTIKYSDGSIATVIYSTIGDSSYPKERIEIFNENKVIVIDDFKEIQLAGTKEKSIKLKSIQKGHNEFLKAFIQYLLGERDQEDIPLIDDGIQATKTALKILKAAKSS